MSTAIGPERKRSSLQRSSIERLIHIENQKMETLQRTRLGGRRLEGNELTELIKDVYGTRDKSQQRHLTIEHPKQEYLRR